MDTPAEESTTSQHQPEVVVEEGNKDEVEVFPREMEEKASMIEQVKLVASMLNTASQAEVIQFLLNSNKEIYGQLSIASAIENKDNRNHTNGQQASHSENANGCHLEWNSEKERTIQLDRQEARGDAQDFDDSVSIAQFSTAIYYCIESETSMDVDVVRLGNCMSSGSVKFATRDGSAKAGQKYVHTTGTVEFAPNETSKQIRIPLLQDEAWEATHEFQLVLSEPQGMILPKYLRECRVKVIDDDTFPTNKYMDLLQNQKCFEISHFPLMIEYFKMNLRDNVVKKGSLKVIICDQLHNLYFLLNIWLSMYMVDVVLKDHDNKGSQDHDMDDDGGDGEGDNTNWASQLDGNQTDTNPFSNDHVSPQTQLIMVCLLTVCPMFFLHFLDYRRSFWKVGGVSRKRIQANLLRKFLNYDEQSRWQLKHSELVMALTRDTTELVHLGYIQVFAILKAVSRVTLILCFQLYLGKWAPIIPVIGFPIFMGCFLRMRQRTTHQAQNRANEAQTSLVEYIDITMSGYHLIADYGQRPRFNKQFEDKINVLNAAITSETAQMVHNKYFAPWLKTLLMASWILFGGGWTLGMWGNGSLSLGVYLATYSIFRSVGNEFLKIQKIMLAMQSVAPGLQRITRCMNLPVDVEPRMKLNREKRKVGTKYLHLERDEALRHHAKGTPADRVQLRIDDATFAYRSDLHDKLNQPPLLKCSGAFHQGEFVVVVGPHGGGKSTFLKMLGGVLLPHDGHVFIPPWLRALHVSPRPLFFEGTLLENLIFGVLLSTDPEDAEISRVIKVCEKLKVGPEMIAKIRSQVVENWSETLSKTTRRGFNLARALIANPEVLVVHTPADGLDDQMSENTINMLRKFCNQKGLYQDKATWAERRPRTCIFTATRIAEVDNADRIFLVREHKAHEIPRNEVTDDLLF